MDMEREEVRSLLIRIDKARRRILQPYLAQLGLTLGQGHVRILDTLLRGDHLTQRELADACRVDAATMSRSLDKLEEAGFLTREKDPDSRRSFLICLTPEGLEEAKRVRFGLRYVDDKIWAGIAPEDSEAFCRCLNRICSSLETSEDIRP